MLTIICKESDGRLRDLHYRVHGVRFECGSWIENMISRIVRIEADGADLKWISEHFINIPMTDASTVRWYGTIAKMIVGNLHMLDYWDDSESCSW